MSGDRDLPGPSLRRPPELQPGVPPASDPRLVARIASEIDAAGPLTFARFMELALYDPEAGYYRSASERPGRSGDFLTAPEAHPVFGWALARQVHELWELLDRPDLFVVREHGPGSGALIAAILDELTRMASPALGRLRYQPVEVEPRRIETLVSRLSSAGHGERIDLPAARARTARQAEPDRPLDAVTGLVLANEVLDALPVHRVRGTAEGTIQELYVDRDPAVADGFRSVAGPASTPALAARLAAEGITLREGQEAEICVAVDGWIESVAAELRRGLLLIVDYGYPAAALYDPVRRPRGTLLGYRRHRAVDDPYSSIGRQDLTAHVDLTAVERAANAADLVTVGLTSQAELLASLGAGELLAELRERPGTTLAAYLEARSALVRMVDPAAMGGFRVLAFGRGLPARSRLRGFELRLPAR